jgi:hypothetical protein
VLSVAVGGAAGAAALAITGAPSGVDSASRNASALTASRTLTPAHNERPLGSPTKRVLSAWAAQLTSCLSVDGVEFGPPRTRRRDIAIRVRLSPRLTEDPSPLTMQMSRCARKLGNPPRHATVTIGRRAIRQGEGEIRVFKAKICALPSAPKASL